MKLVLGVAEIPYATGETTGDVARRLEARYHIMQRFAAAYDGVIRDELGKALAEGFEVLQTSGRPPKDVFAGAMAQIEQRFRLFLDLRELDHAGDPGIPTKASLRGVNHRLAKPYSPSNPPRSSFIDSGLFQQSFKSWVE